MIKPGRKSHAQLQLATVTVLPVGPDAPPARLSASAAHIWTHIVSSQPPGWLTLPTQGMLEAYCAAVEQRERIAAQLPECSLKSSKQLQRYERLIALQCKQTMLCSSLATKLRLTPQSRYTPQRAATAQKNAPEFPPPWVAKS
jgi:hypothetical protein